MKNKTRRQRDYERNKRWVYRTGRKGLDGGCRPWMLAYFRYVQNHCCCYCNRLMFEVAPQHHPRAETIEHVLPLSRGGKHSWENVVLACSECNKRKSNRGPQALRGSSQRPKPSEGRATARREI